MGIRSLAILDRDGTIVEGVAAADGHMSSAFSPDRLRFIPHAVAGLRLLQDAGFVLAIATNQPGAAKGQATRDDIARTNDALLARTGADRASTWMIGDSLVDVEAGKAAGVRTAQLGPGVTLVDVAQQILRNRE